MRQTSARILLAKYFEDHPNQHYTAGQILEALQGSLPSLNLSTVHRNLKSMVKEGTVTISDMGWGVPVFESITNDHHHIICIECGRVGTVDTGRVDNFFNGILAESSAKEIVFKKMVSRHMIFYGICDNCDK